MSGFVFEYVANRASDPSGQIADLAQTFTYLLAIFPLLDKLCFRLCYRLASTMSWAVLGLLAIECHRDRELLVLHRLLHDPDLRLPSNRAGTSPESDLDVFMVDCRSYPVANHLSTRPFSSLELS